ncbi:helix-turn-helix transcriptional regulator (plasmid) [Leifsonia sp. ZF2019]|uniref:helix-turn-helix domain-containing protein n=1 Tax=Leifsonia sp. ZF2019 TaxID=2781978 RepID=UPI001CBC54FF|nr:helix-turn-helix transcriptional regulator [Leifsonia sp. ZF2019]UAJ81775.1 helix-turn-helix transcriptional regulator [Leifsonia sp. ZF2019]
MSDMRAVSPPTLNDALAAELRMARALAGIPIKQLASELSLGRFTVQRIFKGEKEITAGELIKLADAMRVDLGELISKARDRARNEAERAAEAKAAHDAQLLREIQNL